MSNANRTRNSVDQNNATSKPDINHGKEDVFDESISLIKDHVAKTNNNNTNNSDDRNKQKQSVINQCWNHIEIIGDFMINGIQERGMNKD